MADFTFPIIDPEGERSLGSARALVARKVLEKVLPWEVTFEITQNCNLKCTHCYNFDRSGARPEQLRSDLSSEEIIDLIDQIYAAGGFGLCFTGGESLVHPQIFNFIEHARSYSMNVSIKTNGVLLTEKRVARLADLGVQEVWVSLYGSESETHDRLTAVQSSFDKSVQGCERVVEAGMRLRIASVLTEDNVDQIRDMEALAVRLNADFMINPEVKSRHDGTDSSREHIPVFDSTREVFDKHSDLFVYQPDFNPNRCMQCECATNSCAITATGDVYPCMNAPLAAGNVREKSFQEIWSNSPIFQRIRAIKHTDFKDCQGCEDKPWCARSSGTVFTNTGDYLGSDPVTCGQAKVRREVWEKNNGKVNVQDKFREHLATKSLEEDSDSVPGSVDCPA